MWRVIFITNAPAPTAHSIDFAHPLFSLHRVNIFYNFVFYNIKSISITVTK